MTVCDAWIHPWAGCVLNEGHVGHHVAANGTWRKRDTMAQCPFTQDGIRCGLKPDHSGPCQFPDNETEPACRATLHLETSVRSTHGCVLPENHAGPHRDEDDDTWDITYRDEPKPFVMNVRPADKQLTDLATRVGLLETARTYLAPEDERSGNYLHGRTHDDLIRELYQRLSDVEAARDRQRRGIADTAARVRELEGVFRPLRKDVSALHTRVTELKADMHPEECHGEQCVKSEEKGSVTLSPEELHAPRNAAPAAIIDEPLVRCEWVCPTARRRCVLGVSPATGSHPGNHLT